MRDYAEIAHNLRCCGVGVPCDDCTYQNDITKCASLEGQAADAIKELQAAVPKWHPVSEPPKENKEYLVFIPNVGLITKANYLYGEWNYDSLHMEINHLVSDWMSLPEPPKEEN